MNDRLLDLSTDECLQLLTLGAVGRIGVIDDGVPVVLPVNYWLVVTDGEPRIRIRTRQGNVIDQPGRVACFEIDGVGGSATTGWSVLVRGRLVPVDVIDNEPDSCSTPGIDGHDSWLELAPVHITGRRLGAPEVTWTFDERGYL